MTTPTPQLLDFQALPQTSPLTSELVQEMAALLASPSWLDSFNCLTAFRSINRYSPQYTPHLVEHFLDKLADLLLNGVPLVVKNSLLLVKEIFSNGSQLDVRVCVMFVPSVIKKAVLGKGNVKDMAGDALTQFVLNCAYDESFRVVAELCFDKVPEVGVMAVKVLAKLLEAVGGNIVQLGSESLKMITVCLFELMEGKRPDMKTCAHEIAMFVFSTLGADHFVQLLNYALSGEQVAAMMGAMNKKHTEMESKANSRLSKRSAELLRDKENYHTGVNRQTN